MKKIFKLLLYLGLFLIILFACLNFLSLTSSYLLSSQYYQKLSSDNNTPLPEEVQEMKEYCRSISDELNFITVSKYLTTLPPIYYTWKIADDGQKREIDYYVNVCFISSQLGRRLSETEANRLAQYYIVPSIEFFYGFISRWFVWLIAIYSFWKIGKDLFSFIKQKRNSSVKPTDIS